MIYCLVVALMEAAQSFTGNPFHLVFHLCVPVQIVFVVLDSLTLLACHSYLFVYTCLRTMIQTLVVLI